MPSAIQTLLRAGEFLRTGPKKGLSSLTHIGELEMANTPSSTPDALRQTITEVMQSMAVTLPNPFAVAATKTGKKDQIEALTIRAFKKAGFGSVTPRIDVKTFRLWLKEGFRPVAGTRSVRVGSLRLFHRSQVQRLAEAASNVTQLKLI
jgi:hypothetical protein